MEAKVKTEIVVTMSLEEARFIKTLVQNYLGDDDEPEYERRLRLTIFSSLNEATLHLC